MSACIALVVQRMPERLPVELLVSRRESRTCRKLRRPAPGHKGADGPSRAPPATGSAFLQCLRPGWELPAGKVLQLWGPTGDKGRTGPYHQDSLGIVPCQGAGAAVLTNTSGGLLSNGGNWLSRQDAHGRGRSW